MQFLRGIVKTIAGISLSSRLNSISRQIHKKTPSLVMVEWYTRNNEYHDKIKALVKNLEKDDEYYVKKAVQWINKNFKKGK